MRLPARHLIPAALASVLLTGCFSSASTGGDGDGKRGILQHMAVSRRLLAEHRKAAKGKLDLIIGVSAPRKNTGT